tara:strand:+ start:10330 stop:11223 length:894 start_codon:yes stop_codon:yes gene_type:complete
MSKIKIDEIESLTTSSPNNGDLTITPDGDGVFEVAGRKNGTLQLNSINNANNVKIKSPANSAAQNYTMVLPNNNIAADKLLKVDSISGSGANAVGQLTFADVPASSPSSINADNISTNTLSVDRFGLVAERAGLQLISKNSVGATNVSEIVVTGFEADTMYLLIGKNITGDANFGTSALYVEPLDANDNAYDNSSINYEIFYGNSDTASSVTASRYLFRTGLNNSKFGFIVEISNLSSYGSFLARGMTPQFDDNKMELYGSFKSQDKRIHKLKIYPYNSSREFTQNTQILLYKYLEN